MFLVHFGANLWCLNDHFDSALDVAVRCGRQELARFLESTASRQLLSNPKSVEKLRQKAAVSAERRMRKKHRIVDDSPMTSYDSLSSTSRLNMSMWKTRTLPTMRISSDSMSTTSSFQPYTTLTLSSELAGGRYKPSHGGDALSSYHPSKQSKDDVRLVSETGESEGIVRPEAEAENRRKCKHRKLPSHSANTRTFPTVKSTGRAIETNQRRPRSRTNERKFEPVMARSVSVSDDSSLYCRVLDAVVDGDAGNTSKSRAVEVRRRGTTAEDRRPDSFVVAPRCIPSPSTVTETMTSLRSPEAGQSRAGVDSCNSAYSEPCDYRSSDDVRCDSSSMKAFIRQSNNVSQSRSSAGCSNQQAPPVRRRLVAKLADFLTELGLQEYLPLLCRERVDMQSLSLLTDDDLRQLGLPLGPRRTLMNGLERLSSVDTRL